VVDGINTITRQQDAYAASLIMVRTSF